MIKICPVCGKKFNAGKGNVKYCSDACRLTGSADTRKRWEERTGYKDQQRLKRRSDTQKRRSERALLQADTNNRNAENNAVRASERAQARRQDIEKRAAAGDPLAGMLLAKMDGNDLQYWRSYQEYEMSLCDQLGNTQKNVNGISVFTDPDLFADLVIESIKSTGRIVIS